MRGGDVARPARRELTEYGSDERASVAHGSNRDLDLTVAVDSVERVLDPADRHRLASWGAVGPHNDLVPSRRRIRFSRPVTVWSDGR